ncbi:hypothetical protein DSO57_1036435 [Entomophthora muscae]|uniref:Uncharacterized protein n=1 Tax=Entomophthora muscae TaxID=34485 RepID=A0ACC2RQ77_9FUNG|nr:hypothetical protein DSO57_1036435 [Entomophthora muscae]
MAPFPKPYPKDNVLEGNNLHGIRQVDGVTLPNDTTSESTNSSLVIGCSIGGLLALCLIGFIIFKVIKSKKRSQGA